MKKYVPYIFISALTACVSVEETYTQSGEKAYSLDCSGASGGWGGCYQEAGNLCRERGYSVENKVADSSTTTQRVGESDENIFQSRTRNHRSMTIICK